MNIQRNWEGIGGELKEEERIVNKKIAVLGHSYVRDLPLPAGSTIPGNVNDIVLRKRFYKPGATVDNLQEGRVWEKFLEYKPDLTILIIGGNDITADSSPPNIARRIIDLAKRIKELTEGEVRIVSIERRPTPRGLSARRYNRQRNSINRFLKHRDNFTAGRLIFSEATDGDSQDGVHLKESASHNLVKLIEDQIDKFLEQ